MGDLNFNIVYEDSSIDYNKEFFKYKSNIKYNIDFFTEMERYSFDEIDFRKNLLNLVKDFKFENKKELNDLIERKIKSKTTKNELNSLKFDINRIRDYINQMIREGNIIGINSHKFYENIDSYFDFHISARVLPMFFPPSNSKNKNFLQESLKKSIENLKSNGNKKAYAEQNISLFLGYKDEQEFEQKAYLYCLINHKNHFFVSYFLERLIDCLYFPEKLNKENEINITWYSTRIFPLIIFLQIDKITKNTPFLTLEEFKEIEGVGTKYPEYCRQRLRNLLSEV